MKSTLIAALTALAAKQVAGHATFQQLWVNGVDKICYPLLRMEHGSTCARLPLSNSPIASVESNDIRCNAGTSPAASKCSVAAGETVTVEMHQQPGDRSCSNEAIGGNHYGPVMVYMSKVDDASTADGSAGWFKVFQDGWKKASTSSQGGDDYWGVKDLNTCCGKMDVKIPADIPAGDYLLRAEVIALHSASGQNGAQPYVTCYQLTVTGGGSASPATVNFPGAYSASDPGILVNIWAQLSDYAVPGPEVYSGGSTKEAGSACTGCEDTCAAASKKRFIQW